MFCSSSVSMHSLRGAAALALIASAIWFNQTLGSTGSVLALVSAVLLMRGCPMCWLLGLIETIKKPAQAPSWESKTKELQEPRLKRRPAPTTVFRSLR
jgi:hypothetical protein